MTDNPQADPLTAEQLDLIEARAAHLYEYPAHAVDVEILTGTEVPELLAEVRRLRDRNTELETGLNDLAHLVSHWYNRAQEAKARMADEAQQIETQAAVRAAVLREAAKIADELLPTVDASWRDSLEDAWNEGTRAVGIELRRMADEAQQAETQAEDPARIDRLRPEFTEHASVESIDVQLRRARSQMRRWHLRTEWLISLRQARLEQKARGEWPAASDRCPHGCDVSTCPCLACEVDQPDGETQQPETGPFVPPAHYRGRDGTAYCVHAIPIGPDSCPHCRELADEQPAAVSQPAREA